MNGYLLDTNVPSELTRTRPDARVQQWLRDQATNTLFLSAITIGEIRKGLVLLPASRRLTELESWFSKDLRNWFQSRILPVTSEIADRWGTLDGHRQISGAPLNTADGLIAATALEHDLTLVTRNVRDFRDLGLNMLNPWDAS